MPNGINRAASIARRAAHDVPAYRTILRENGYRCPVTVDTFDQLPTTAKDDYVARFGVDELSWHGDAASAGTWSATSGSTGAPTFFPRDVLANADATAAYGRILGSFGTHYRSTLVIDCFAMGSWIGGTYTYLAALELRQRGHRISVSTPGIENGAAVEVLRELAPHYEQVILAGYPTFVKDILDRAPAAALAHDIKVLLAGEAITEAWRDHVLRRLDTDDPGRISLIYGTAEAGVMGHETPQTTAIRRLAVADSGLDAALFGESGARTCTFVQFDPQSRYTEVDDDGYLLFTCDSSSMPLIRYRINDQGRVLRGSQLRDLLVDAGHPDTAALLDPAAGFIVLSGRPDVAVTFYALNVFASDIRPAVESSCVADRLTGKFVIDAEFDENQDQRLAISIELAAGQAASADLASRLQQLCIDALVDSNRNYRTLRASVGEKSSPRIILVPNGNDPFTPDIKHRYVRKSR